MNAAVLGQQAVVERLVIALLANGSVLMEGRPGTAKTRSIKTLSGLIDSQFSRVQFTPDLLPSDVPVRRCIASKPARLLAGAVTLSRT